jgi:hypothetical protein
MPRIASYRFSLLGLTAGLLYGDVTVGGPLAGYIGDPAGAELRAIYGVPGSFRFGEPLPLPGVVTRIHLAPGQSFALAERGEAGLGRPELRNPPLKNGNGTMACGKPGRLHFRLG